MLNCQGVKQGKSVIWGTSDCSPCGIPYVREAGKHFIEPLSRMWINSLLLHKRLLSGVENGFIIIIALARIMIINDTCVDFVYKIPSLQLKQAAICSFPAFSSAAELEIYHLFSKLIPVKHFFWLYRARKREKEEMFERFEQKRIGTELVEDKWCFIFVGTKAATTFLFFIAAEPNQTPLIMSSTSSLFDFNEITSEVPELGFSLDYHCVCRSFGGRCAWKGCVKLIKFSVLN